MKRAHQKREVHTSTAQLLLCIASVDDDAAAAAAAEERKAKSSAVTMFSAGGCREDPGLRLPNAMTAPAKGGVRGWGLGEAAGRGRSRRRSSPGPATRGETGTARRTGREVGRRPNSKRTGNGGPRVSKHRSGLVEGARAWSVSSSAGSRWPGPARTTTRNRTRDLLCF